MINRFFTRYARFLALLLLLLPMAYAAVQRVEIINQHAYENLNGPDDPDPWLRLVLVRDLLRGVDGWFSHEVNGTNAPYGGISSPWTRPVDITLTALVALQPGHASLSNKLMRAAACLPVLWMGLLLLGLTRAGRILHDNPITHLAIVGLVTATPSLWSYFDEGNADHHAPLAALWAWVISCAIRPHQTARNSWLTGALLATMLWISPEGLILIAIIYLWPMLGWLYDRRNLMPMVHLTTATAWCSLIALVVERAPDQWLTPVYDSISIVHVVLLALCAIAMRILALVPPERLPLRKHMLLAAGVIGAAILAVMHGIYPKFFHGPMADADPYVFTDFLPRINEAHPLWSKSPLFVCGVTLLPVTALVLYARMLRARDPQIARPRAAQMLYLLLTTFAMAVSQLRWHYYLFPMTSLALAPLIAAAFEQNATWPSRLLTGSELKQAAIRLAILALIFGAPYELVQLSPGDPDNSVTADCDDDLRAIIHSGALEDALGEQPLTLFAPTNYGAEILFFTPYRIIASNYHREARAIKYLWDADNLDNQRAIADYMRTRQVDAIALCPSDHPLYETLLQVKTHAPAGSWATRIHVDGAPDLGLWRIRHPAPTAR